MTTRAELLEQCKAAGLKATGWKKEKMEAELAKLATPTSETPDDEKPSAASSSGVDSTPDDEDLPAPAGTHKSGWCSGAPTWGSAHLACQARYDSLPRGCGCSCHAEGWVRPPIPPGAVPSKFDREAREQLGLPWEPIPDKGRLADARKLAAGGGDNDGSPGKPGDPADAGPAGVAGLVGQAV